MSRALTKMLQTTTLSRSHLITEKEREQVLHESVSALILDFTTPKNVSNTFLLFIKHLA